VRDRDTATIRVPVDLPTIDHRERLWDRGAQSRPAHPRFFSKKNVGIGSSGDIEATHIDVRFTPKADIAQHRSHDRLVPKAVIT
jgi:hypothetical protein